MIARDRRTPWAFLLLLAWIGCASPPPLRVGERDLSEILELASARSDHFGPADFRIALVEARERDVTVELIAREDSDDWTRTETSLCHRVDDRAPWTCSVPFPTTAIRLADGHPVAVTGLAIREARSALRFLAGAGPDRLPGVLRITRLASASDDLIAVELDSFPSHGGVSTDSLILRKRNGSFAVESETPTSDWFGRSNEGDANETSAPAR